MAPFPMREGGREGGERQDIWEGGEEEAGKARLCVHILHALYYIRYILHTYTHSIEMRIWLASNH